MYISCDTFKVSHKGFTETCKAFMRYFESEVKIMKINRETLNQAIQEFNETGLISELVYFEEDERFDVIAFHSIVDRNQTIINGISIFSKGEFEESKQIEEDDLKLINRRLDMLEEKGLEAQEDYYWFYL